MPPATAARLLPRSETSNRPDTEGSTPVRYSHVCRSTERLVRPSRPAPAVIDLGVKQRLARSLGLPFLAGFGAVHSLRAASVEQTASVSTDHSGGPGCAARHARIHYTACPAITLRPIRSKSLALLRSPLQRYLTTRLNPLLNTNHPVVWRCNY